MFQYTYCLLKLVLVALIFWDGYLDTLLGELLFNILRYFTIGGNFNIKKKILLDSLSTGNQVTLHYLYETPVEYTKAIIVISHGIGDFCLSSYINHWFQLANDNNLTVIAIQRKSLKATYNDEDDYIAVNDIIFQMYPNKPIIGMGFSAGGLHTTRYATYNDCKWTAAAVVSSCFDLKSMIGFLKERPLLNEFLYHCVSTIHMKHSHYGIKANKLTEFDEVYAHDILGYDSITTYYDKMATQRDLFNVKIPFMILTSKNDPLLPDDTIVDILMASNKNKNIIPIVTEKGGHLGWIKWNGLKPYSVMQDYLIAFVNKFIKTESI